MQKFVGLRRMRIRKPHHRNTVSAVLSVPPEDVPPVAVGPLLKLGWDGGGRSSATTSTTMEGQVVKKTTTTGTGTATATGTGTEQSGLDSATTISRQSASPGVSMLQRGHAVVEEAAMSSMKPEPDLAVHPGGSTNDDAIDPGAEPEGSTLSVEQLWQGHDGADHVTRHYVRRSHVTRTGDDNPPLTHFESPITAAARRSALEVPIILFSRIIRMRMRAMRTVPFFSP
jgi:hypothetical protein